MAIPKRVANRINAGLRRFRKILESARNADRSEQDTVTIVIDLLSDVLGFDKYSEVTGEYAVRGTYCDLAVKVDKKLIYFVEVKAIGKSLKGGHVRQATDYAAKEGLEWVVLTNGVDWQVYHMKFEQPVCSELSFSFNMLTGGSELLEMLYTLSREGISKRAIDEYHEQMQATNKHVLAALMLSEPVLSVVRREIRRMNPGVRVSVEEIEEIVRTQVIKRDVVEGDEIDDARRTIQKARRRALRSKKPRRRRGATGTDESIAARADSGASS